VLLLTKGRASAGGGKGEENVSLNDVEVANAFCVKDAEKKEKKKKVGGSRDREHQDYGRARKKKKKRLTFCG